MKNLKKEYDAFGPWILKIKNQEEVPPLFDKYIQYDETSRFYKIPKNITRREARPGDELYKSLIAFEENQLVFLKRSKDLLSKQIIEYRNIECIQNRVDLLNGTLIIESPDKKVQVPYNAVSSNLIIEVISRLRNDYIKYFNNTDIVTIKNDYTLPKNYFYKGILTKMKSKEDIIVLDAQETIEIIKKEKKWYDHLLDVYNPMIFQKIMFLTNHRELIIISRKDGIKRKRSSDYSHIHTYIPLEIIEDVVYQAHDTYEDLYEVIVFLSNKKLIFYTTHLEIPNPLNI